jgi:hypothetical protein
MAQGPLNKDPGLWSDENAESGDVEGTEIAAARSPFAVALLAAGRQDRMSPANRQQVVRNISLAVGVPISLPNNPDVPLPEAQLPPGQPLAPGQPLVPGQPLPPTQLPVSPPDVGAGLSGLANSAGWGGLTKMVGAVAVAGASVWGGWKLYSAQTVNSPVATEVNSQTGSAIVGEAVDVTGEQNTGHQPVREPQAPAEVSVSGEQPDQQADEQAAEPAAVDAPAVKGRGAKVKSTDSLSKELTLIDSARASLLRGDPASALRTLQTYSAQFPNGALRAEATVQRVEALIASGDRASATRVGERFLKRYPDSPYSRRIVSLLGGAKDPGVDSARKNK